MLTSVEETDENNEEWACYKAVVIYLQGSTCSSICCRVSFCPQLPLSFHPSQIPSSSCGRVISFEGRARKWVSIDHVIYISINFIYSGYFSQNPEIGRNKKSQTLGMMSILQLQQDSVADDIHRCYWHRSNCSAPWIDRGHHMRSQRSIRLRPAAAISLSEHKHLQFDNWRLLPCISDVIAITRLMSKNALIGLGAYFKTLTLNLIRIAGGFVGGRLGASQPCQQFQFYIPC